MPCTSRWNSLLWTPCGWIPLSSSRTSTAGVNEMGFSSKPTRHCIVTVATNDHLQFGNQVVLWVCGDAPFQRMYMIFQNSLEPLPFSTYQDCQSAHCVRISIDSNSYFDWKSLKTWARESWLVQTEDTEFRCIPHRLDDSSKTICITAIYPSPICLDIIADFTLTHS